jgi:Fe-S-cluster containining protein
VSEQRLPIVRCLSFHARYRCRDSGACCSSGWPIPVEAPFYERLVDAITDGSLTVAQPLPHSAAAPAAVASPGPASASASASASAVAVATASASVSSTASISSRLSAAFEPFTPQRALPEGAAAVLRQTDHGRCVFHEAGARRCRIHRVKGHAALPVACQQFPRMCLIDARGIHVTLSHYCPTAASLLFEETPMAIVSNPPGFPPDAAYEGLDARDAFPPLLRPGVLMDWDTVDAFETHAIRILDSEIVSVDAALARIETLAERLRQWRATDGPLRASFDRALGASLAAIRSAAAFHERAPRFTFDEILKLDAEVRGAVPPGSVIESAAPAAPGDARGTLDGVPVMTPRAVSEAHERWVQPAWTAFTRPLCRYLAARLFANWCWYQGQGLRSLIRSLHAALAVLRIEAARQTLTHGRMLEAPMLREAFRRSDLLLIHLCAQEVLAHGWAVAETADRRDTWRPA